MTAGASPLVSVAIPTRNRARLLRRAIESVLAQTFTDWEVLVSDNASQDGTADVVASFGDPRVRHLPLAEDIGMAANQLRCLALGAAPYVAVLQDDDVMLPTNLERKVALLERRPGTGLVHSAFRIVDSAAAVLEPCANWEGPVGDVVRPGREFLRRSLAAGYRCHVSTLVVRRSALDLHALAPADGAAVELAVSLQVALRADVAFLAEPLCEVMCHPGQDSVVRGIGVLASAGQERTAAQVSLYREVAHRFLDRHRADLPDAPQLRRASSRWIRYELRRQIVSTLPPGRCLREAVSRLRSGARVEPSLAWSPKSAWVLLNAAVPAPRRASLVAVRAAVAPAGSAPSVRAGRRR